VIKKKNAEVVDSKSHLAGRRDQWEKKREVSIYKKNANPGKQPHWKRSAGAIEYGKHVKK